MRKCVVCGSKTKLHYEPKSKTNMYRIRSLKNVPSKCTRLGNLSVNYSSKNNSGSTKSQSFIGRFVDNIRDELAKNKEMKESLKNFRAETEKIEQSETLKAARQKFVEFEKEAARNSDVFKDRILSIRDRFQEVFTEATKTDLARKAGKISEDFTKTVSQTSQQIGKSSAFQTISQVTSAVKKEIDNEVVEGKVYEQPKKLRKRKEVDESETIDYSKIKADDQTTHIDLTKESKFSESWQRFKATNPYVQQVFEWKIRYDESSNPMIRVSRALTDRLTTLTSGLFEKNDLSKVLTELCHIDPQFDAQKFLAECEQDFIPNILEAMAQHDLEILRDWCFEGPYNIFRYQSEQLRAQKHRMHTQILDIDNVDIVTGRTVDDHGPVLILSFQAQMISYIEDFNGNIIEGSTDKVYRANYVWAMCRDPNELDPKAAWKLLECSMQMMQQLI